MIKHKLSKFLSILTILALFLIFPTSSFAYSIAKTTSGQTVYGLRDSSITFQSWSGFTQETRWAIDYASRQWNSRTGQTKLFHSPTQHGQANKLPAHDGKNLITKTSLAGTNLANKLMVTGTVTKLYGSKYQICEADIVINSDFPWRNNGSTAGFDVQNVMTHEFGHMLGLDHTNVAWATMIEGTNKGDTWKRTLEQDDLNGFNFLY